jgi:hypothetical protein
MFLNNEKWLARLPATNFYHIFQSQARGKKG